MGNKEFNKTGPLSEAEMNTIVSMPEEYIENRVEDQIKWLFAKSATMFNDFVLTVERMIGNNP